MPLLFTDLRRKRDGGDGSVHVFLPDVLEEKEQVGVKNARDLRVSFPAQGRSAKAHRSKRGTKKHTEKQAP